MPIVATIVTLLFIPMMNSVGHMLGHGIHLGQQHSLRCVGGKPVKATPLAKRLNVVGKTCKTQIVRRVRIAPPNA
jgi:hypothetical protein